MQSSASIRVIKLRRMIWVGHVAIMGEMRNAWKVLVKKKSQGNTSLGRTSDGWGGNIKVDVKEIVHENVD
jgi:hypothetical protein